MSFLNSLQLKQKVKNKANQLNNVSSESVLQNVVMEHFIRRIAASDYRDHFVIKGGVLITSLVGVNNRTTRDLDTTVRNLHLSEENLRKILTEIGNIDLNDGFTFLIEKVDPIRLETDYPGVRFSMKGFFDKTRQSFKIDITTTDAITPHEIDYELSSLFSDPISIKAYPLETILAEKLETSLSRSVANTRLRDYYDIGALYDQYKDQIDYKLLFEALTNTATRRGSIELLDDFQNIFEIIKHNEEMHSKWNNYATNNPYAQKYLFTELCDVACSIFSTALETKKERPPLDSVMSNAHNRSKMQDTGRTTQNKDDPLI